MAPRLFQILTDSCGRLANIAVRTGACACPGCRAGRHDSGRAGFLGGGTGENGDFAGGKPMNQRPSYRLAGRKKSSIPAAWLIALTLLAALGPPADAATIPTATPRYTLTVLGALGGSLSDAAGINDTGWAVGDATLPGDTTEHAALWRWCIVMCNAMAFGGVNDLGQVVGTAETASVDPTCMPPQILDWEAVVWGPRVGEIRELRPYPGDPVGLGAAINDEGQVVGQSGSCTTPLASASTQHALLWQDGAPIGLGSLGGVTNNAAVAINNRGQVAGFSDLPGDSTGHAFIWQNGVMSDLGTLPGKHCPAMCLSSAWGINDAGQVVGQSCQTNGDCRAFLWQDGAMRDLNAITDRNTPEGTFDLIWAQGINSQGAIVGAAMNQSTGEELGFTALPCDGSPATDESCSRAAQSTLANPGLRAPGPQTMLAPDRSWPRASTFEELPRSSPTRRSVWQRFGGTRCRSPVVSQGANGGW
jgi:probable HAF family extracellular repeat protein